MALSGLPTGLAYASRRTGVMHACGHDGHTAMLLAAARQIAEKAEFSGTLNLIFQPAEEGQGGAVKMIEDGLFDQHPCDAVFAMHNAPGFPQGQLLFRDGPAMASSDYAKITLTGVGGHAAFPHRATDPVVAAASIVMALQTIVSRNVDPLMTSVVTVGTLHAGTVSNIIPGVATPGRLQALHRELRARRDRHQTLQSYGRARRAAPAGPGQHRHPGAGAGQRRGAGLPRVHRHHRARAAQARRPARRWPS
jgi:hippurate hydrolase